MTDELSRLNRTINELNSSIYNLNSEIRRMEFLLEKSLIYQEKSYEALDKLQYGLERLKDTIINIEIAKIESKKSHLEKYLSNVNNIKTIVERRFDSEYDRVRTSYSKAVLGIVKKFVDSAKTGAISTRPLVTVLESYNRLRNIVDSLLDIVKKLQELYLSIYQNRINELIESKNEVISKMEEFLRV